MGILGRPRSFHKKWKFLVNIPGLGYFGFAKCGELSMEIATVSHWEGGRIIPHKSPGRVTFADVTLERGATQDRDLFDWATEVARVAAGVGLVDDAYKRHVEVVQQDRDGRRLRGWPLFNAFPVKFVAGEWDNDSDDVVIESLTLTYDYFDLRQR
jgi:phage tail-like protein